MSVRRQRTLSAEDRILWNKVARSVTPMRPQAFDPEDAATELDAAAFEPPEPISAPPSRPREMAASHLHPIDRRTRERIAKGKLAIEARADLHGMSQAQAHTLLLGFLHRAHLQGVRTVLVITGKGTSRGSEGALRRALPLWLATPPFRGLVSGYEPAHRTHGGDGAFYVRLARR